MIISNRDKMYPIKSWALPLVQNLHRIMQNANIFMAGLEEEFFSSTELQPLLWLRYLDDIFCLVGWYH